MAYIRVKKRKSGIRYTAEIKLKKKGKVIYQESRTFSARKLAKIWSDQREAELKVNGLPAKNSHLTLSDLIDNYINEYTDVLRLGRSKKMDFKKLQAAPICSISCHEVTSGKLVQHIKQRLATGIKPQTANNDIVWINVLLKFGIATLDIQADLSQLEAAKSFLRTAGLISRSTQRDRIPTPDEHHRLIDYFTKKDRRSSIPMTDILQFAMYSARRQGEITRIEWQDNNNQNKTGIVRDLKHPRNKIGNHKGFSYTQEAWEIIQKQTQNNARIFPYNCRSISANFTRACKILEIHDLRFHDYRHLATSWLFTQGLAIHEVSQYTLHESWDVLKRYTHLSRQDKNDIQSIYSH